MKLIALVSVLFSAATFASTPLNVCFEEFKRTGDVAAFEFCMSEENKPMSIPHNVCADQFGLGTTEYNKCIEGAYDKPMSIPRHLCAEQFGYDTPAYEACINGELDEPMSIPRQLCKEFGYGTPAYNACMNGEFDEPATLVDCDGFKHLPFETWPLECRQDEFGQPMI